MHSLAVISKYKINNMYLTLEHAVAVKQAGPHNTPQSLKPLQRVLLVLSASPRAIPININIRIDKRHDAIPIILIPRTYNIIPVT